MQRKWLLVVLVVLAVIAVVATVLGGGGKNATACRSFIAAIQDSDTEKSYSMLSTIAQDRLKESEWNITANALHDYYNNVEPKLLNKKTVVDLGTDQPQEKETYVIETRTGTYDFTCFTATDGKHIDAFESKARP